jgi:hypothetical protein
MLNALALSIRSKRCAARQGGRRHDRHQHAATWSPSTPPTCWRRSALCRLAGPLPSTATARCSCDDVFPDRPGDGRGGEPPARDRVRHVEPGLRLLHDDHQRRSTATEAFEVLARKLGLLLCSLAAVHFVNLYVFHRLAARRRQAELAPPVAPQLTVHRADPPATPAASPTGAARSPRTVRPSRPLRAGPGLNPRTPPSTPRRPTWTRSPSTTTCTAPCAAGAGRGWRPSPPTCRSGSWRPTPPRRPGSSPSSRGWARSSWWWPMAGLITVGRGSAGRVHRVPLGHRGLPGVGLAPEPTDPGPDRRELLPPGLDQPGPDRSPPRSAGMHR